MEILNNILNLFKENMKKTLSHLEINFSKIRAGRASPLILQSIMVKSYGHYTPLSKIANITILDALTISIHPFDGSLISAIEKSIIDANLGLSPTNNGKIILINLPILTEERRKELKKQIKIEAENVKISIRNFRKLANTEFKKNKDLSEDILKVYLEKLQKLTNFYTNEVEKRCVIKSNEIMNL